MPPRGISGMLGVSNSWAEVRACSRNGVRTEPAPTLVGLRRSFVSVLCHLVSSITEKAPVMSHRAVGAPMPPVALKKRDREGLDLRVRVGGRVAIRKRVCSGGETMSGVTIPDQVTT